MAGAILLACLTYSAGAMTSHLLALQQRSFDKYAAAASAWQGVVSARDHAKGVRDRAEADYSGAISDLARLGKPRPVATIQAEIADARVDARTWRDTEQCSTRLEVARFRDACEPVVRLYRERGDATRYAEAAERAATKRAELETAAEKLAAAEAALAGSPKPDAPWAVRLWLAAVLPWVFAVVIQICGTAGFVLAGVGHGAQRAPAPAPSHDQVTADPPRKLARPAKPSTLADLLRGLETGETTAPGCTITPDGWLNASQRDLAAVLGGSAATVSREIKRLRDAGLVAVRASGTGQHIKLLSPP